MRRVLTVLIVLGALGVGATLPGTAGAQTSAPANDTFAAARSVSGASGSINGSNVAATKEPGEPNHAGSAGGASIWYQWVAPSSGSATITTIGSGFDTLLGVYTGSTAAGLTAVAANDDISNSVYQSSVTFTAASGTTYRIAIDGWRNNAGVAATGTSTLNWTVAAAPVGPANDAFAGAQVISSASGTTNGSNVGATKEPGEPNHLAANAGGASVWYRWSAPADGQATISTAGSAFDTVLAVYTGSTLSGLTAVAVNDDISSSVYQSRVTFTAVSGTTYQIAIDGWRSGSGSIATGAIALAWSLGSAPTAPPNDAFASGQVITAATGTATGSNVGATKQAGEPSHAGSGGGASVWYRWIAPSSGRVTVSTTGSTFDTLLASYTGSTVSTLTNVASNDDISGSVFQSRMAFDVIAGAEYRIAVDGWRNRAGTAATGSVTLTWSLVASGAPVLAAAGDVATCSGGHDEDTGALLSSLPDAAVAMLGDGVYPDGAVAEYANCYDPSWGAAKSRTRPTPGHHDYATPGAAGYYGYFGAAAGDPSLGYYSYDLGSWHVVALNGLCSQVAGGCSQGSPQEQWLRADLAAHPTACTLAYWHTPLFSSGDEGTDSRLLPLWQDLHRKGVDVVLNGHDHLYERFAPQAPDGTRDDTYGIREFVVGTGGVDHGAFGTIVPNSQIRNATTYGVLTLSLRTNGYDWQFLPATGGSFTDAGSDSCHGAP